MKKQNRIDLCLILSAISSGTLILSGCADGISSEAPPRSTEKFIGEVGESVVTLPVSADLTGLSRDLEREIPKRLWTVDQADQICAPPKTVKVLIVKLKTPTIKCRIVGEVTRGAISLTGSGENIVASMPVNATIRAKDIGGILKQETATARAIVTVTVQLDITPSWRTSGTADINYQWTDSPHIDFLGQRIDLTQEANKKMQPVVARLEKSIPHELAKLPLRSEAKKAWNSAFTSLNLNEKNPPVWMRVTPRQVHYSGYRVDSGRLYLKLGITANTETFLGKRPPDPKRLALPPLVRNDKAQQAFRLNIPVIADYRTLEPVLARALAKREQRPFDLPGTGPVMAHFQKVTIYGTENEKMAVGLKFTAKTSSGSTSNGTVWLTAKPVNAPNSMHVDFSDLEVTGVTDSVSADLLIKLANTPAISQLVADELGQNFSKDYKSLRGKIDATLARKQAGNFTISAQIADITTGSLRATAQGLYLPVQASGTARVQIRP